MGFGLRSRCAVSCNIPSLKPVGWNWKERSGRLWNVLSRVLHWRTCSNISSHFSHHLPLPTPCYCRPGHTTLASVPFDVPPLGPAWQTRSPHGQRALCPVGASEGLWRGLQSKSVTKIRSVSSRTFQGLECLNFGDCLLWAGINEFQPFGTQVWEVLGTWSQLGSLGRLVA